MKQILRYFPEGTVLLILILIAGALRLYGYASFSFSNDELSAILRAQQPGFLAMINNGVIPDFHPAGIETLIYYWIKGFGTSEAAVRLPFVIFGILSLIPAYFIGKRWFGRVSGLFFASSLAFLQFPLLFSQIARPYSSGLFFSLSMIVFWTRLVFPEQKDYSHTKLSITGYALTVAACAYDHYFCGLMAIIVSITGFIYLKRDRLIPYCISLIISSILFIPHIKISLQHFSIGGIGSWLGKPDNDWIPQHLFYLFNQSWFFIFIALIVFILSIFINRNKLSFNKFHIISLSWFLSPLLIGFFYSLTINPVLQNSVLIFSSPFLLLLMVSFWKDNWSPPAFLALSVYTLCGVIDTVVIQKYYQQQHFGEFKDIAAKVDEWNTKLGVDKITQVISVNNPYYIDLYFNRLNKSYKFAQYDNRGGKDLFDLVQLIKTCKTPYFITAWTKPAPDEITAIVRTKYPCIIENIDYQGLSGITLYTDQSGNGIPCIKDTALFQVINNFEGKDLWGSDSKKLSTEFSVSGKYSILLDSTVEFGPTYQSVLQHINTWPFKLLRISVDAKMVEEGCDAQIVADLARPDGKSYGWASANFNNFLTINEKGKVFFTYYLPENINPKDQLKVYIWNHGLKKVYVDDFRIQFYNK